MNISTRWHYDTESEAKRIFHTAHQIAMHFYQINDFLVLPTHPTHLTPDLVIYPDIAYTTIPKFYHHAKKLDIKRPLVIPKLIYPKFSKLITPHLKPQDWSQKLEAEWTRSQQDIIEAITDLIPQTPQLLHSITCYPSQFGTISSFTYPQNGHMEIYLRRDADINRITGCVLLGLTRPHAYAQLHAEWSESQLIVDWLLTQSKLSRLIPTHHTPIIHQLRNTQSTILKAESSAYLQALGFHPQARILDIEDGRIVHNHRPLVGLKPAQKQVLSHLITHRHITTDQLADLIFTSDADFSLYAIAKFIQRLRCLLEQNGISGSYLTTIRGYGYTLAR